MTVSDNASDRSRFNGCTGVAASADLSAAVDQARITLEVLAGKWVVPIIGVLAAGALRHSDLHDAPGIRLVSQKVLTETLRRMEATGLLERHVKSEVPPAVLYGLTDVGRSLLTPIRHLAEWASDNSDQLRRR